MPPVSTAAKPRAASLRWTSAGVLLARRVQQVGQVGVQRGQPVLVAQLTAEGQRFLGQRQCLGQAAALGQQPGQVVQRGHGRPAVRQLPGLGQALPQLSRGGRRVARRAASMPSTFSAWATAAGSAAARAAVSACPASWAASVVSPRR